MGLLLPCRDLCPLQWRNGAACSSAIKTRGRSRWAVATSAPRDLNHSEMDKQHEFNRSKYSQLLARGTSITAKTLVDHDYQNHRIFAPARGITGRL
jgi:hypothetical protein